MSREFSENDVNTWDDANLPAGYEWRDFDAFTGELHLFASDGRDLTIEWSERQARLDYLLPAGPETFEDWVNGTSRVWWTVDDWKNWEMHG